MYFYQHLTPDLFGLRARSPLGVATGPRGQAPGALRSPSRPMRRGPLAIYQVRRYQSHRRHPSRRRGLRPCSRLRVFPTLVVALRVLLVVVHLVALRFP
jgi:hypothetical protein